MNYSKGIKKISIAKRVVASWVIVAVLFSLVGFGIGSIVFNRGRPETETTEQTAQPEVQEIYGQHEGRVFESEVLLDWGSGDLDFIPLDVPLNEDVQEFIFYLSAGYNIDFTFTMALIQHESGFQADVISETDDYGLMQINSCNHDYLKETIGVSDFLDPYSNIRSGMFILRKLFEKYETPEKVLMAYNMGESGASKLWERGIYETNYSKAVLQIQQQFKEELERGEVEN